MRLPQSLRLSSIPILFTSVLLASHVAAQNLPKLPPAGGATSTSAAATTKGAEATTTTSTSGTTSATASASAATATVPSSSDTAGLSGLPKLAQDNYPAPTVPPTADAPFMQKSNLPDGTVFIVFGGALGFFGFLILAWRGLVAWSVQRSVKRAALAQSVKYAPIRDPAFDLGKTKGPYSNPGHGSTLSLEHLGAVEQNGTGKGGMTSQSARGSLFFSPTAAAAMHTANNKVSSYHPAGYYAAGNSAPGSGSGKAHIGGGGIGLSDYRPGSQRYSRGGIIVPSPPGSPSLPSSRGVGSTYHERMGTVGLTPQTSNGSLNPSTTPHGRAPSTYLDELFESHVPASPQSEEHARGRRF